MEDYSSVLLLLLSISLSALVNIDGWRCGGGDSGSRGPENCRRRSSSIASPG
ncbi:MAG: hypothetical protein WC483_03440 [Candidatus Paceibacterota bacterium]